MQLQKDYYRKKFRNTLYPGAEDRARSGRFWLFRNRRANQIGSLVIFFGLVYFFFYSPIFLFNKIQISGLRDIPTEEINNLIKDQQSQRRFLIFKQSNFFIFSKKKLNEQLSAKYVLSNLIIKKRLLHTLKIYLQEKTSTLTWITGDKFYYLNLEGQVISEVPFGSPNPNFPKIYDESNKSVSNGQTVIQPAQIRFIIDVLTQLPLKIGDITVNSFRLPNNGNDEIKMATNQGWQVYFNANLTVASQLEKLALVYEKKIKGGELKDLKYVDLRFGDKVFYK